MAGIDCIEVFGDIAETAALRLRFRDRRTVAERRVCAELRFDPLLRLLLQGPTSGREYGRHTLLREERAIDTASSLRQRHRRHRLRR